jgi:uracil phosphoribosyltransferase
MPEVAYLESRFLATEIPHHYGANVHLLDDPLAWTLLARLCSADTKQPQLGRLVRMLYERLAQVVVAAELPRARIDVPTRMAATSPSAVVRGLAVDDSTKVVTVGIARAGTVPSQIVYDLLNEILDPAGVRQDHLFMSRQVDEKGKVIGATWHDAKIGRDIGGRTVLFPDPMGATGGSLSSALTHYKTRLEGRPRRCITMHLIVTPEYVRNVLRDHPETIIYAWRLDRGLSSPEVLGTVPGTHWDNEKGLDEHQYIVPGAGGVGELLNNAWV